MSKKHFEALARELSFIENMECRKTAVLAVIHAIQHFNAQFNVEQFSRACGIIE